MFVGHLAIALASKRAVPRVSLGVLVGATAWLDLIWPPLLLLGLERVRVDPGNTAFTPLAFDSYPWSHSLVMVLLWGALAGLAIYLRATRPIERLGSILFWSLVALCTVMWAGGPFSPPPPGAEAVAKFSVGVWLLPLWAGWADAHRRPASTARV